MTLRTRTVEFAFPFSAGSVATATQRVFTAKTCEIAENTSRTIRSAIVEYTMVDNAATAASVTAVNLSIQVDAVGASAATVTQTITNSGENQAFIFQKDVTVYFATNFTGTSHSITAACTITGIATHNASAKLIITYEFDDASATTRTKTVRIPVDGAITALTTTYANLGGVASQIPNLSTFLPEASKVYKSIFFEWITHTGTTAAAASTLDISYDGGVTTVADTSFGHTLISDTFYKRIDDLTATLDTAASANLQAKVTSVTGKPCNCICGYLVVTYQYDHASSTQIMNHKMLALVDEPGWAGGTATTDKSRFQRTISVQEPGTITLAQSGVLMSFSDSGAVTLDLRIGAQASRTFTQAATVRCGSLTAMRRIDSGASGGAGMTLARGDNTLTVDWFTTSATVGNQGSNFSGVLLLNYTSDKHASGDGVHDHTTIWNLREYSTGNLTTRVQAAGLRTPIIPETEFWLSGLGYEVPIMTSGTAAAQFGLSVSGEVQASEAEAGGWRSMFSSFVATDAEIGPVLMWGRARDEFERWPGDDPSRLGLETARDYRYDSSLSAAVIWQMRMLVSYHSITYQINGTISGSAGGTVTIDAYRVSDGLKIGSTSRVGNGTYTMTWYDNVNNVYVVAYESSTLNGRSDAGVAGTTMNIDLATGGGGGGPTYYAY